MYLRIRGDEFTSALLSEIGAITDRSLISPADVGFDEPAGLLRVPVRRFKVTRRKKFLGSIAPYARDMSNPISCTITIRGVGSCTVVRSREGPTLSEVTMLFGLKLDGRRVYFCSAEEEHGTPCYSLRAELATLDIELRDEDEED